MTFQNLTEELLGKVCQQKKVTIAIAESVTGGLICSRITKVPGSSAYFLGGIIAYSNDLKEKLLTVSHETLARFGAVSSETAKEMAEGVLHLTKSHYALATTGIAGPTGATKEKPVGLVYVALSSPAKTEIKKLNLTGARRSIQEEATEKALFYFIEFIRNA